MLLKKTNLPKVIKNIYLTKNEPVSIVHFLTNRCNARCSFCFIDFDDPNTFKNELTLEEIEKVRSGSNRGKHLRSSEMFNRIRKSPKIKIKVSPNKETLNQINSINQKYNDWFNQQIK